MSKEDEEKKKGSSSENPWNREDPGLTAQISNTREENGKRKK